MCMKNHRIYITVPIMYIAIEFNVNKTLTPIGFTVFNKVSKRKQQKKIGGIFS